MHFNRSEFSQRAAFLPQTAALRRPKELAIWGGGGGGGGGGAWLVGGVERGPITLKYWPSITISSEGRKEKRLRTYIRNG